MKIAGFALLLSGWFIVVFALGLLPQAAARAVFVVAGCLVEFLGIFLAGRAHRESIAGGR
jgi:hypothetical protein